MWAGGILPEHMSVNFDHFPAFFSLLQADTRLAIFADRIRGHSRLWLLGCGLVKQKSSVQCGKPAACSP
jgi:hypothetical protein